MKFVKMAAAALAAIALLASCKDDKSGLDNNLANKMTLRVDPSALRSMEAPVPGGTAATFASLKIIVNGGEVVEELTDANKIAKAASAEGYTFTIKSKPTKVVVEANTYVADPEITTLQGVATVPTDYDPANAADQIAIFAKKIALIGTAEGAAITGPVKDGQDNVYTATVKPTPDVARIEVAGKIVGQKNATSGLNAFKNIDVEAVYVNNYLMKKADADRYLTPSDGNTSFKEDEKPLKAEMNDAIVAGMKANFEAKKVAAAYQLFPTKSGETEFDHIILKVKLQYDLKVVKNRTQEFEEGYVTIVKYKDDAAALTGFAAGKIYKLDLATLSEHFKTDDKGNPDTPVTPDPEHDGSNKLTVKVETFTWEAVNITPDGFKK